MIGLPVRLDAQAREGNTRRISERQIALRRQGFVWCDREFSGPPAGVKLQGLIFGRTNVTGVYAAGGPSLREAQAGSRRPLLNAVSLESAFHGVKSRG
jgi:hypothetical protein